MSERFSSLGQLAGQWLPAPALAILAIAAWQVLCITVYQGKAYLVPAPLDVASAAAGNATLLANAALTTLREALFGFALAALFGIALAAAMSQSRLLERCLYPYAVLLQTVPVVAVAPLIVLWSGYNERSVVLIALIMALFPIVNNTLLGLRSTPHQLLELFSLHRAGRWTTFIRLRLPAALPHTLAGLRISAGLSVIGAIVGEFIIGSGNADGGLGVQIVFAQGRMDTALLFAEVVAATMLGFALFSAVSGAGRLLLRHWHESAR
ncbi:MAG: ABC transporter permease [Pseudomonadota bacterium]